MKMKIIHSVIAIVVAFIMISAPSAFAQTGAPLSKHPQAAYKSGFNHGLTDGKNSCIRPDADQDKCDGNHDYVAQPGKGFINQTKEFINGYITAWCSVNPPGSGMDSDEATFDSRVWCIVENLHSCHSFMIEGQPRDQGVRKNSEIRPVHQWEDIRTEYGLALSIVG